MQPIRDTERLRLLGRQERLREQIARNVARAPAADVDPPKKKPAPKYGKPVVKTATAANLEEAREKLGAAVGIKPFKDYVRRKYGEVDEAVLREFLRGNNASQIFGPPPRSEGKMAALGHKDSWYVDLILSLIHI